MNRAIVFQCHRRFKNGRQNLDDNERQGREAVTHTSNSTLFKDGTYRGPLPYHKIIVIIVINVSRGIVLNILANVLIMEKDIYHYITLIKMFNASIRNNFHIKYNYSIL